MRVSFCFIMTHNVFPPPDDKDNSGDDPGNDPFDDNGKDPIDRALDKLGESVSSIFGAFGKKKLQTENTAAGKPTLETLFAHIQKNNAEGVRKVLEAGVDPNAFAQDGSTALLLATRRDLPDIARLLLEAGADPKLGAEKKSDIHPIEVAINYGHPRMVELLAAHGGYTPGEMVNGRTQLMRAVEKGKVDLVLAIIRASGTGGEIAGEEETNVLARAIERFNFPLAEALLDLPSLATQINTITLGNGSTLLMAAIQRRQLSLVRKLVDKGAFVNKHLNGVSPLAAAIRVADPDIVEVLAMCGADLNAPDQPSLCLLSDLPLKTNEDDIRRMLRILLAYGANSDQANAQGMLPLHLSIKTQNAVLCRGLLAAGAATNRHDGQRLTPLAHAVIVNDTALIVALLECKVDPDQPVGQNGETALMLSIRYDHKKALEQLLAAGADPTRVDANGKTAACHARARQQHDNLAILERALEEKLRGHGRKKPCGGDVRFQP